jgi:hypothetical protein
VLDFSDRTFSIFFSQELNVDIDDPVYSKDGTSKLRRLKCYLRTVENDAAAQALQTLWDYREMRRQNGEDPVANAHGRFLQLLTRSAASPTMTPATSPSLPSTARSSGSCMPTYWRCRR